MTTNAVTGFVSDLMAMAKAMEELPAVREELARANDTLAERGQTIHHREAEIHSLREQITAMSTRIASAEVARDDAELRFLDLEERASAVAVALAVACKAVDVANALAEAMTAKPTGEAHSQAEANPPITDPQASASEWPQSLFVRDQSATDPIANSPATPFGGELSGNQSFSSEGVSVLPDPTIAPIGQGGTDMTTSVSDTATPSANATSDATPKTTASDPAKPYLGKRYSQVHDWVSLDDWEAGGGTLNDYYY